MSTLPASVLARRRSTYSNAHSFHGLQILEGLCSQLHLFHSLLKLIVVFRVVFLVGCAQSSTTGFNTGLREIWLASRIRLVCMLY